MILNHQLGLKKTECIFELMILNNNQVIKNNLLIVFFLISLVIISSQTSAQNCSEASDSLEINIEFIGYNSCNLLISAESSVFNYSSDDYDIDIEYLWSVDEYLLPNGISTEIPNLIALSGDSLTSTFEITLTNLDSLSLGIEYAITCSYSEVISMQEIEETYDLWSCDCQLGGQPEASFEVQNAGTCGNTGITFSNTAIGGQGPTYDWSFGNNYEYGQSFEASPIVEILIDGGGSSSIPVTLLIVDINGCTDQVTEMVDILQTPNPGNSFDIDNLCTGNPNEVSQSVSFLPLPYANGGIEEIIIDWDIGVVSYQQPFDPFFNIESPLYTGFGYYNIGIDLIGYNGCVTTIIESLFIGNNPQIGTANPGNTDGLCSPFLLDFPISNFSTNDNSTTYEVDFGDGTEPSTFSHPPPALVSHNYFTSSCGSSTPEGNINAFRFKVEATNDCGTSTTTVDPIRIHSAPAPVISGEDTVCVNVPWTYQSPNTGVWVDDNSFECQEQDGFWDIIPLEGQTPPTPNFGLGVSLQTIFNEPGLYDIHILEMHESCDDGEDYFQVCVYPELFPLAEFTPNNGCIPLEVELNDISPPIACGSIIRQWQIIGGEYEWAQESSPNSINPTVILLEGVDYQINLVHTPDFTFNNPNTPASTYCNTGIYSMTVEAYDIPEVEIEVLNEHLCEGESTTSNVIFFDNGNLDEFDFQWIVDGVVISEENAPITLPLFSSGIHTVQSITSNICGTDIDLIDITVETNPVITVDGPLGDCIGNTISFEASGAENYLWTGNNDDVNANPAEYVVSNTTTETVTGSIDYGSITCYSYESFEIEAYTIPQIEINGDLELCDQDIISLTTLISSGTPDYEVTWSEANESLTNLEFISTAILSTSPITATVFDINGCSSNNQVVFTINPLPSVTAGVDIELCNQEISTILSESDPSGGTWQGLGITNSSTGEFDPSIIGEGATELIYEYTDGYGCTNSDSLIIDVVAPIFANAGPDLAICNIDTIVTLEGFFPDDGVWTDPNVSPTNDIDITGFSPGVYSYTYSFGEETCYTQDMMLLEVHGRPNLDWSGPQSLCINETGVFELSIEGGTGPYIIEWLTEMDEIQDDGYLAINTWDASGPQQQEVFVTDFYGCSNYVSFEVIINPPPLVNAGPDTSFCNQPIPGNILGFSPGLTEGGVGYFYGLDDAALPGAVSTNGAVDPSVTGIGTFEVVYSFTSEATGCTNLDTLTILISDPLVADAGMDTVICFNAPLVQLEGYYPDIGILWSGTEEISDGAVIDAQTGIINPQLLNPGAYTFLLEYGVGTCYSTDIVNVTIDPLPIITLGGGDVVCENDGIVNLSTFDPLGGVWEGTGVLDDENGTFNADVGVGDWDLIYWYTDPLTTCSDTAAYMVNVQEIPEVYAGPDTSFCNQPIPGNILGFSPGLTEGGVGYFYGLDDAALPGAVSTNGAVDPSVTGIGTFEVVYSFTSEATGCTNLDTLTILISDPLVADAGMDTVICFNAPLVQLEGYYPDIGILWSGTEEISDGAVIDAQTGIINPQLLNPGAYTFLLEYGVGTCYSTDIVNVTIDPLPAIDISSDEAFCGNLGEVSLISPIPNGGYWFGDNVVDPIEGIINTNVTQGNYEYFYTYTDPVTTCSDTIVHQVDIFPVPVSLFSTDELGCNNTNYPFEQLSTGAIEFEWDLGNGEVSDASTPDYIYPDIGTYEVTLFASNFWGCMDTSNVNIEVTELPVPYFIMSTEFGCAPLEVSFVNESYSPYGEFEWTMNGEIFTNETPPNQFFIQGDSILMHEVQLTVSNLCGSDTFLDSITVLPIPQMSFYLLNDTACSPFSAELLYSGLGLPNEINWDYGNGQTSTGSTPISPIYIVDSLLTVFDITVTGENECGTDIFTLPIWIQPNTLDAFFTSNVTSGCPPLELVVENVSITPVNMTFDFGDGNFSSEDSATNIYYEEGEYTITQYITNGCSYDTIAIDISVHPEPQFSLISEASEFCEGEEANFSVDVVSPGSISWEFGDEGLDVGMSVNYTFDNSGTYEVVATVESNFYGCVGTETIGIEVFPTPVLEISSLLDYGCSPLEVEFENLSTDTDFWIWDFDDSSINGVVSSPTHTFVNTTYDQQNFNVGVNAATINGCESDTTFTISVLPAPIADFVITEDLFCGIPSFINMTNISDGAQAYSWSFNDQETSGMFETIYEANQFGPLVVELVATNGFGCTDEEAQTINIYEYPVPQILFTPNSGCEPLEITFNDVSEGAISSHITIANSDWLIHNGPIPNVPLTINNSGNYIIHMTAVSSEGCIANLEAPEMIYVWPKPIADFDAQPVVGSTNDPSASHLSNTEFEFINTSIGYETSYWVLSNGAISNENNPTFDFLEAGNYFVTLVATSDMGCVNSHQETVIIPSVLDIYVPNAFTPSYDGASTPGINDAFRCEFSNLDAVDSFQLQIYNRWGILVWETNDPEEYWQGETGFDGLHYSQNDMYIWHMKIQSNTWVNNGKELKGYVTIIR